MTSAAIRTHEAIQTRPAIPTEAALERWTADPRRTTVEFEVEHLWGAHTVRGRFDSFEGTYTVGPSGTRIELTVDAASIDTGCPKRDDHLRSADFFGVEEHPLLRFTSTRVIGVGSGSARVTGELEAAGIRVPLAFDVAVRLVDGELELEARTSVDQARFDMPEGPLRNVRRPARLRVKTRLVRTGGHV
jgi:polyisoprenoid-binding protein YceI